MSEFSVNLAGMQRTMDEYERLAVLLRKSASEVLAVKRDLNFHLLQRLLVNQYLSGIADDLTAQRDALGRMVTTGRKIAELYRQTEEDLLDSASHLPDILQILNLLNPLEVLKWIREKHRREAEELIRNYEQANPEDARRLNEFLSSEVAQCLTEEDIFRIKYMAYTAKEPYRSIYLRSLSQYTIVSINQDVNADGGNYNPAQGGINLSYPNSFGKDPRGDYNTLFHEGGHAIDDCSNVTEEDGYDTGSFTAYSEKLGKDITLREAIQYDVYYNRDNPNSITSIAEALKQDGADGSTDAVIRALQNGTDPKTLSNDDLALYRDVLNQYRRVTDTSATYMAVSDVYGSVSHNALRTGWGHGNDYWVEDPTRTEKELWAEFFANNMTGDEKALAIMREYYPESYKVLEEYAYAVY